MKITGPRNVDTPAARRVGRRDAPAGDFTLDRTEAETRVAAVTQTRPLAAVDTLLALQTVSVSGDGRRRAVRRAGAMLDLLEDIRVGLLEGLLPKVKIESLLRVVRMRRDEIADAQLARVLDEVELRACVELAKFGAAPFGRRGPDEAERA